MPLHPLTKTADEIQAFLYELFGPSEEVGHYEMGKVTIEEDGGYLIIEAQWLGRYVDDIVVDRDAGGVFASTRRWRLPVKDVAERLAKHA